MLQSILCPTKYPLSDFKKWLLAHKYIPMKPIHVTQDYYHARLKNPMPGASYYTTTLPNGIHLVSMSGYGGEEYNDGDDMQNDENFLRELDPLSKKIRGFYNQLKRSMKVRFLDIMADIANMRDINMFRDLVEYDISQYD